MRRQRCRLGMTRTNQEEQSPAPSKPSAFHLIAIYALAKDEDEILSLLEEAHALRHSMRGALEHELSELFEADCDDDVPEELMEPEAPETLAAAPPRLQRILRAPPLIRLRGPELADRALDFWGRRPNCQRQALAPNEYAAFAQAAEGENLEGGAAASSRSGSCSPSSSGNSRGWLRFGTISEEGLRPESALLSDHLAIAWQCPRCRHTFRFTRRDIAEHRAECLGDEAADRDDLEFPPEGQLTAVGTGTSLGKSSWLCDVCGAALLDPSPMEKLRHRRAHGL